MYSNPQNFPEANIFPKFNLKKLLERSHLKYDIKDILDIEEWIKDQTPGPWQKQGLQYLVIYKSEDFNPQPFLDKIKELLKG